MWGRVDVFVILSTSERHPLLTEITYLDTPSLPVLENDLEYEGEAIGRLKGLSKLVCTTHDRRMVSQTLGDTK